MLCGRGQVYRKAPGKAHRESASTGRAQRATWAQATRSRGETSAGPKQAGRAALCSRQASLGGRRRLLHGRGGPGSQVTRSEANKVSRAPKRLGCASTVTATGSDRGKNLSGFRDVSLRDGCLAHCTGGATSGRALKASKGTD